MTAIYFQIVYLQNGGLANGEKRASSNPCNPCHRFGG